jgi:hypothetical protein
LDAKEVREAKKKKKKKKMKEKAEGQLLKDCQNLTESRKKETEKDSTQMIGKSFVYYFGCLFEKAEEKKTLIVVEKNFEMIGMYSKIMKNYLKR